MSSLLRFFLYFVIVFALQAVIAPRLAVFGAAPDFAMLLVVHVALRHGSAAGALAGFLCGLTEDVYGPLEWVGSGALSKCTVGFFAGFLEEKFMKLGPTGKVAVLGVSFFLGDAISLSAVGMTRSQIGDVFLHRSLPEGIYTMVIGAIVFLVFHPRIRRT